MSRTLRFKNFELIWLHNTPGFKYGGHYTMSEWDRLGERYIYRAPTDTERSKLYYRIHGESTTSSQRGANSYYKRQQAKQKRQHAKDELRKFMLNDDHLVMILASNKKDDWWW